MSLILIEVRKLREKHKAEIVEYLESRKNEVESSMIGKKVRDAYQAIIVDKVEVYGECYRFKGRSVRMTDGVPFKRGGVGYVDYTSFKWSRDNLNWFKKINGCKFEDI